MPYLSDTFVSSYSDQNVPFGGNGYGEFIYLRTYSRWLPDKRRREYWSETVQRAVEHSMELYQGPATHAELSAEAEELFDSIFHLRLFPAGRTLWAGGSEASKIFPLSNFNCSFCIIDNFQAFSDIFYLLMVGSGTGFRILDEDIAKLPKVNNSIVLANKPFHAKAPSERIQHTMKFEDDGSVYIVVGDSKEGWVESLGFYLEAIQRFDVDAIIINYDSVRPKGEILKIFGGRASGHEALRDMFKSMHKVVSRSGSSLSPIDVLDMLNIVASSVVSGGVRRSSQISLFSPNDESVMKAKLNMWEEDSENFFAREWRAMSNNSIFFNEKPSKEHLLDIFSKIVSNGEPGFLNAEAARKRRPNFDGTNPCGEVLLANRGLCNLTSVNLKAFSSPDGITDMKALDRAVQLATRIGLRQTNIDLELAGWNENQKRDRLLGVSISGITDAFDEMNYDREDFRDLLAKIGTVAEMEADKYAYEMRVPRPLLVTTVKPEGSVSQMPVISQGAHRSVGPFYIRRVRITATDPLGRVMRDLGYPTYPEGMKDTIGFDALAPYEKLEMLQAAHTWVIEFPIRSAAKMRKTDESALEQFQRYLDLQRYWTDHNTSVTINFAEEEIDGLVDAVLENWDDYIGIAFLPKLEKAPYALMPEEAISESEYWNRMTPLKSVIPGDVRKLLTQYEVDDLSSEIIDDSCTTGVCPIR